MLLNVHSIDVGDVSDISKTIQLYNVFINFSIYVVTVKVGNFAVYIGCGFRYTKR
jgi:hypothetical protein